MKILHKKQSWFWVFTLVVGVVLVGIYLYRLPHSRFGWQVVRNDDNKGVIVSRVIDGDTLEVDGKSVRLIGVDAPEKEYKEQREECFAEEAKDKLRELVEGKEIRLEKDVSEKDKYDRLLRYVYMGEENINEVLVREGFAKLATYPPDVKYYSKLKEAQRVAKEGKVGLWKDCPN